MTIEKIIRETLIIDDNIELNDETGPEDIDAWDSLGHINIITAIEEEYNIEIPPEEIMNIKKVGDIKSFLSAQDLLPE
jgi:acyl carrier protein